MTCLIKLSSYVFTVVVFMQFRTASCARSSKLQRRFDRTLKERQVLASMNLSISCLQDFSLYLQRLEDGATWALNMFDSSAKPESGMLKGGHTLLGFYSECLGALHPDLAVMDTANNSTMVPEFTSIYCLSTLRLTSEPKKSRKAHLRPICDQLRGVDLTFAVCAPSTCTEEDVGKIAAFSFRDSGCAANATSTVCRRPIEPFLEDVPAITVAVTLAMLAAVVLGATLFDWKRRKGVRKSENPPDSVGATKNGISVPRIGPPEPNHKTNRERTVLCFSLLQNGKKVFGIDSAQTGSIRVLHGLRFFSMAWVICIHTRIGSMEMGTIRNVDDQNIRNFKTELVTRAPLAIDTFFFLGGLVVAFSTLKQLRKNGGKKNWLLFYVHRYLRTVPLVMIVVAICAFLMRHFGDGPRWADFLATYETNCHISWWTYLLCVQNFVHLDHQCLAHTWYSAADFQMYLITPPILYALYKKPRVGVFIIGILAVASIILSATYSSLMIMRFAEYFDYNQDIYKKPYFRISPYLLGMLMGVYLSKGHKAMYPPKKCYLYLGWMACAFCVLFPIFGLWITDPAAPTPWYGTFMPITSSLWALGIAWIIYACLAGCGGIFTSVLASQALEPLSKLTFSTYIIHSTTLHIFFANLEGSFYYSSFLMSYIFAGNLLLSYAVSVIFCLFIELPIFNIERLLLGSK